MGTHPLLADTDGDGLWDALEDRNRDGILDADETDPRVADTDGDGAPDGAEYYLGTDPRDDASVPGPGLVRLEYGTWREGILDTLLVHVYAGAAGQYTLSLNDETGAGGIVAPPDWSAALSDGAATRTLAPGAHVYTFSVRPPEPATPGNDRGVFAFRLLGPGLDASLTAVLVVDAHETGTGGDVLRRCARARIRARAPHAARRVLFAVAGGDNLRKCAARAGQHHRAGRRARCARSLPRAAGGRASRPARHNRRQPARGLHRRRRSRSCRLLHRDARGRVFGGGQHARRAREPAILLPFLRGRVGPGPRRRRPPRGRLGNAANPLR